MDSDPIESDSNIDDLLYALHDDKQHHNHRDVVEDWPWERVDEDRRWRNKSGAHDSILNPSLPFQRGTPQQVQTRSTFSQRIQGLSFSGPDQKLSLESYKQPTNLTQLDLRDSLLGSQFRNSQPSNTWTPSQSQKALNTQYYALPPPLQPHLKAFPGIERQERESSIYEAPPTTTSSPPRSSPPQEPYLSTQGRLNLSHAPPMVRGTALVSLNILPDRFRSIFSFPVFNAIQSRTFPTVYETDDNLVLSSPTGSGKTVILELAICRMIKTHAQGTYKIIYQAPTKALCAERKRDWEKKFATLGLTVTELTGDTESGQIGNVKSGDLIVTTPEKWDSMTRRWQDQRKLLDMVKLFLIDEVHILKESRGATLEVVVSRMKSIGIKVRFIALSATVPNLEDIATWLGRSSTSSESAHLERFGEEFRPVRLQKVVYGYNATSNDFAFDKSLEKHLPDIITKHSSRKPILIFCMTRNMCSSTAKYLAQNYNDSLWPMPHGNFSFNDKELQFTASKGVAYHHAGLDVADRALVERLFLEGGISVICCTSTLSVGVNLPAHLVILKNTVTWAENRTQEYVDLEVMQMLGRAGRPQFDDSGVAVIMTRKEKKEKYEKLMCGQEKLESCLHLNLIEHLNAEIVLGTITTLETAKRWLKSTFLWVRLKKNPSHYRLPGQPAFCLTGADQKLEEILEKDLSALESERIILKDENGVAYKNTEYGVSMARYYVKFETMKAILRLEKRGKMSSILMTMSQAAEYSEVRFRAGEKPVYKELNKSMSMKFPLKDISESFHKVYILMQADIGNVEFPTGETYAKYLSSFNQDKAFVNQHAQRIIRCIVDCRIYDKDSVTTRNALVIARCLSAKCWENSPAQIRQIEGIGNVYVRKLVTAGIRSLADLRNLEAFKIESICSRNPPFGMKVLKDLANTPIFRVYGDVISHLADKVNPVKVSIRVEIGCLNDTTPQRFHGRVLFAIFIAETEGNLIEFRRLPVAKLEGGKDLRFTVELMRPAQVITCSMACEDVVGTTVTYVVTPNIDPSLFPSQQENSPPECKKEKPKVVELDSEDEYEDKDVAAVLEDLDFSHIGNLFTQMNALNNIQQTTAKNTARNASTKSRDLAVINQDFEAEYTQNRAQVEEDEIYIPVKLPNGKWECKHKCGDKKKCKHLCCHVGLDNPPKPSKKKSAAINTHTHCAPSQQSKDFQPSPQLQRRFSLNKAVESVDKDCLIIEEDGCWQNGSTRKSLKSLNRLHEQTSLKPSPVTLERFKGTEKPKFMYQSDEKPDISFLADKAPLRTLTNGVSEKEGFITAKEHMRRDTVTSSSSTDYGDIDAEALNAVNLDEIIEPQSPLQQQASDSWAQATSPVPEEESDEAILARLLEERRTEKEREQKRKKKIERQMDFEMEQELALRKNQQPNPEKAPLVRQLGKRRGKVDNYWTVGKRPACGVTTLKRLRKKATPSGGKEQYNQERVQDGGECGLVWSFFDSGPPLSLVKRAKPAVEDNAMVQVDKDGRLRKKARVGEYVPPSSPPPPIPYSTSTPPPTAQEPKAPVRKLSRIPTVVQGEEDDDLLLPAASEGNWDHGYRHDGQIDRGGGIEGEAEEEESTFEMLHSLIEAVDVKDHDVSPLTFAERPKEAQTVNPERVTGVGKRKEMQLDDVEKLQDVMEFFGDCIEIVDD